MTAQTTSKGKTAEKAVQTAQEEAKALEAKLAAIRAKAKEEAAKIRAAKLAEHNAKVAGRKADLEAKCEAKAKAEAERKAKAPDLVEQLDEHGNPEWVDRNVFLVEIVCSVPGCGQHRFVTNSGALEATMCKPHARKERRKRRMARVKGNAKNAKTIVEEALALGLFPPAFLKKHGLA